MTREEVPSTPSQQAVLDEVKRAQKDNRRNSAKKLIGVVAGIAGFVALSAVLPPVGLGSLPAVTSAVAGALCGFSLLRNAGRAIQLKAAKDGAGKEGFPDKLKARAAKLSKWHDRVDKLWGRCILGAIGVVVAAWAAPAVITGAVAAAAYGALIYTSLGAMAVTETLLGSRDAATSLASAAEKTATAENAAPAKDKTPAAPALAAAPSPAANFDKAANANAPQAAETAAPKSAPTAPKP